MEVAYEPQGIRLPQLDLWLDPSESRPFAFVSHGHADHARAGHGEVLCTPATAELHALRGGSERVRAVPTGEPFEFRGARLTLLPAGHIVGAAQLLVELGGERLLYTGDLKLDEPLCAEPAQMAACDHLIVESTFGLPIFKFPDAGAARERIVEHARSALADGEIPLFAGYALGRGQELVEVLSQAGVPVMAHGAVAKYLDIYARHTGRRFEARPYERAEAHGHAVVGPSGFGRALGRSLAGTRLAAVSGWALLDSARARFGAQVLIPWSDHASFPELLRAVELSGASRIDVVHGFAAPFAAILRSRGLDARAPAVAAEALDREEAAV